VIRVTASLVSIERAFTSKQLLGAALGDLSSWLTWVSVLKASYGDKLSEAEAQAFAGVSGGRQPPTRKVRELIAVVSRRGGKGRIGGALAVYEAALSDHSAKLSPGETGVVATVSPTREQSRILQKYALGFLETSPVLRDEIADVTNDEIRLRNGNVICTLASDFRTLRGRTLLLALLDEAAFLRDEASTSPDIEAARALLPGLTTCNGTLVILSSPYRRSGLLYQRHRDHFGKDDPNTLVVAGPSALFNPLIDSAVIDAARSSDPQAALSEWLGEFRSDLSQFLADDLIDAAVDRSRPLELPPQEKAVYFAFADASAGRHDAFTLCIVHRQGEKIVADVVKGRKPPFDPANAAQEFAALAKQYGCHTITGDNFAAGWVAGAFTAAGINYRRSPLTRSKLYLEGLPQFARGVVSIPDHPQLLRELRLLERRTARSGKDSVDHGVGGSDDYANSLFGALQLAASKQSVSPYALPIIVTTARSYFGDIDYVGGSERNPAHGLPMDGRDSWDQRR
jgi:hypothetical protein